MVFFFAFSDTEGVLKSANDTEFGLAAGVFSNDISKVRLNLNTGFGFYNFILLKCVFIMLISAS